MCTSVPTYILYVRPCLCIVHVLYVCCILYIYHEVYYCTINVHAVSEAQSYDCRWLQRPRGGHSCVDPSPSESSPWAPLRCLCSPNCPGAWDLNHSRSRPGSWQRWQGHIPAACTPHGHRTCPSHRRTPCPTGCCGRPPRDPRSYCCYCSPRESLASLQQERGRGVDHSGFKVEENSSLATC